MKRQVIFLTACIPLFFGCATKSQMNEMTQRVGLLEVKTNRALEKIRKEQAEIKADLIDIRTNTQSITGQLSSQAREQEQKASLESSLTMQLQRLQQQAQQVDQRLQTIEAILGIPPPVPPSPPTGAPEGTAPEGTPGGEPGAAVPEQRTQQPLNMKQAYDAAFNLYREGNLEAARAAFEEFLAAYPATELTDNALFWIAETYYKNGNYKEAIVKYHEIVEKYPRGSKVPDALYKLGLAFSMIGENDAAVSSLQRVITKYPNTPLAKAAQKKLETLKPQQQSGSPAEKKPKQSR